MNYENVASSASPATIVFLIDASNTMNNRMVESQKSQIAMAMDIIEGIFIQIVQESTKGKVPADRYRIGIIGYSDKPIIYTDDIVSIREIKKIPNIPCGGRTNTKAAFEAARELIFREINKWDDQSRNLCPPPMIIHLTDGAYTEGYGDPKDVVDEIKGIEFKDGNVLVENILISRNLSVQASDYGKWMGYLPGDDLNDPYGNELLEMSSTIPETYRQVLKGKTDGKMDLVKGAKLMFPGASEDFVRNAFVMALATDQVLARYVEAEQPDSSEIYTEPPLKK